MVGLKAVSAFGGALLVSGALGGCAGFRFHNRPPPMSYELAAGSVPEAKRIAADLVRSLSNAYAPAKTAVFLQPTRIPFGNPLPAAFNALVRTSRSASFGWELEQALRRNGFAVQPNATDSGFPVVYVLDRLGKASVRASVCVAREWCVGRLYLRNAAGTLVTAGTTARERIRV